MHHKLLQNVSHRTVSAAATAAWRCHSNSKKSFSPTVLFPGL